MKGNNKKVATIVVFALVLGFLVSASIAAAEMTEAEKKALEAEKKAAELAAEGKQPEQQGQPQQEQPPQEGNQQEVKLSEIAGSISVIQGNTVTINGKVLTVSDQTSIVLNGVAVTISGLNVGDKVEGLYDPANNQLAKLAAERNIPGNDQGGNNQAATGSYNGFISAISTGNGVGTMTVGIIGDKTVTFTSRTTITFNGQASHYSLLSVGDTVNVKYDTATNTATLIEAEGFYFKSTYEDVSTVTYVGLIGHIPGRSYGMHTAHGAGVKLGPGTEVTVNGVPATYLDIQVGDTVDYVQNALDLKAFWVKVTR